MAGMSEEIRKPKRSEVWVSHIFYGEKKTRPLYVRIWKVHELAFRNNKPQTFVRFYSMTDDRRKRITYTMRDFLTDFTKAKRKK